MGFPSLRSFLIYDCHIFDSVKIIDREIFMCKNFFTLCPHLIIITGRWLQLMKMKRHFLGRNMSAENLKHHLSVSSFMIYVMFLTLIRDVFYRNPKPSADEAVPTSIKNVICFFGAWKKTKKSSHLIPDIIQKILSAQQEIIFFDIE